MDCVQIILNDNNVLDIINVYLHFQP